MDGDNTQTDKQMTQKNQHPIESLSKEEIISKYIGLLGIAKKAKLAKDELTEENRKLKEALSSSETQKDADKKALLTMKEMLEQFTQNKLELATQLSELQRKSKTDEEQLAQLNIENESLKRQLSRLSEDNESLLNDIDHMEGQLKQVNSLGKDQKQNLELLELEVNRLKEAESSSASLQSQLVVTIAENKALKDETNAITKSLDELSEKYKQVKSINSEQRKKFNFLKERFVDIYRKLKHLKECKRILLETQHEYADAITKWQNDIINASQLLMAQMNALKMENEQLHGKLKEQTIESATKSSEDSEKSVNINNVVLKLCELQRLSEQAYAEYQEKNMALNDVNEENRRLQEQLELLTNAIQVQQADKESIEKLRNDTATEKVYNEEFEKQKLECKRLSQELQDLKTKLQDNEKQLEILQFDKEKLRIELDESYGPEQEQQLLSLRQELANYKEKLENTQISNADEEKELHSKLKEQADQIVRLEFENDAYHNERAELLNLKENAEKVRDEFENKIKLMQQDLKQLQEELDLVMKLRAELEQEKKALLAQLSENENVSEQAKNSHTSATESEELQHNYEALLLQYEQKEREHSDLLGEMRELNEALKARGDVISRQQEKQQELLNELKNTKAKLKQIEDKLNEREQSITVKDEQVRDISREIDEARHKVQELEHVCAKNEQQVRNLNDELHTLRTESAAAVDASDILSTSTISRAEEFNRLREVEESFEEKYNKLRALAVKLKKKLQDQTALIGEMEKQHSSINAIKQELEEWKTKYNDLQGEQEQLQKQLDATKAENQKLKSSRKQANVLNLEIEATEKSLSEATAKLAMKTQELATLNEVLHTKEITIGLLRKEIGILETAKEAEYTHSKELKEQIDRLQTQIKDAVHSKQNTLVASKELEQTHESVKRELEELRLQLANSVSTHEAALTNIQANKQQLEERLQQTEGNLKAEQLKCTAAERNLEDLRVEHLEYKVKAQSVLRKNQSRDTTKERELEEELLALRATEKQQQTNIETHIKRLEESERQMELLKEDNESLKRRGKELLNVIEELRQQTEHLAQENLNQVQAQQEALKNQRQQIENLDACHKEQLKDIEGAYQRQIEQLKSELAKTTRMPIIGATRSSTNISATAAAAATATQPPGSNLLSSEQQSKIDFLLMEREDAEGSEEAEALAHINANISRKISTASTSKRSAHDFMPLDELLNVPMNAISDTITTISATSLGRSKEDGSGANSNSEFDNLQLELHSTKERLQIQERDVRHLTALLAENEQDLAKLTQMNDMLKEELRRQERAVDREKHMHNSEYLKNVILKFCTLNNVDERTRLVPVINTILRLSPSEAEMLTCVAKGQKVPSETNNSRSWSNFLPSWGGNNNNNNN